MLLLLVLLLVDQLRRYTPEDHKCFMRGVQRRVPTCLNITEQNVITGYYWLRWSLNFGSRINTEVSASVKLFLQTACEIEIS